jgi:hypothetical protein
MSQVDQMLYRPFFLLILIGIFLGAASASALSVEPIRPNSPVRATPPSSANFTPSQAKILLDPEGQEDIRIEYFYVSGDYAAAQWVLNNVVEGQAFFRKDDQKWVLVISDGGAFTPEDLSESGIPKAIAKELLSNLYQDASKQF